MTQFSFPHFIPRGVLEQYTNVFGNRVVLDNRSINSGSIISSRDTSSVANWKTKIAKHENATSPYSLNKKTVHLMPNLEIDFVNIGQAKQHTLIGWPTGIYSPDYLLDRADLQDLALTRLKRKVNQDIGDFRAIAPIVELKDLRGTVRDAIRITSETAKAIKHPFRTISRSNPKKLINFLSDAWLTYNFGIAPTVRDMKDAVSSVNKFLEREGFVRRYSGSATGDWVDGSSQKTIIGSFSNVPIRYNQRHHYVLGYKYTAGILYENVKSGLIYSPDHFHLNLGDVVPALWQLLPFSWMADYLGTIGNYLEDTFETTPGQTIYVVENKRVQVKHLQTAEILGKVNRFYMTPHSSEAYWLERIQYASIPARHLRFKTADEIGKNALTKALNLLSILGKRK